ncbi:glycosyltransferase family 2 protein [Enterobacter hormaechei]
MKTREFGISVVIPSYNRIDTLLRAVDSIDSCQKEKVEIIVVDDCSDFDIYSVLQRYNKNNIPIRIFKNSTNKGPQVSRNVGIRRASFEFVAFLDSDDYFSPDKIDWLLQILANQDIDSFIMPLMVAKSTIKSQIYGLKLLVNYSIFAGLYVSLIHV